MEVLDGTPGRYRAVAPEARVQGSRPRGGRRQNQPHRQREVRERTAPAVGRLSGFGDAEVDCEVDLVGGLAKGRSIADLMSSLMAPRYAGAPSGNKAAHPRKLMPHSVKRHLDVDADAYDAEIRRFIPDYDDMLATGVDLLSSLAPPGARVLDLGGGTGALSAAVLRRLPEARVTVLDVDRAMLGEARRSVLHFGYRVQILSGSCLCQTRV